MPTPEIPQNFQTDHSHLDILSNHRHNVKNNLDKMSNINHHLFFSFAHIGSAQPGSQRHLVRVMSSPIGSTDAAFFAFGAKLADVVLKVTQGIDEPVDFGLTFAGGGCFFGE